VPLTRLGRAVRAVHGEGPGRGTAQPHREEHRQTNWLRDVILGGQDGLVNILGIILGVIAGGGTQAVLLSAGFAAAITESISMGAVGWTSALSERDYYAAEQGRESVEIDATPEAERAVALEQGQHPAHAVHRVEGRQGKSPWYPDRRNRPPHRKRPVWLSVPGLRSSAGLLLRSLNTVLRLVRGAACSLRISRLVFGDHVGWGFAGQVFADVRGCCHGDAWQRLASDASHVR